MMFGQRKLKRILMVVEDIKFEVAGWSASVRETNRRLDLIEKGQRRMAGEIEALRETAANIDVSSDRIIERLKELVAKIDELLSLVAEVSNNAVENAALKRGIAEVRNALQLQVKQNEAAVPPPAPPAEG